MADRKASQESIEVEIFGSTYTLRGGVDPSAVRSLAQDLDTRMHELERSAPGAEPLRVAVLAALRLADEARLVREEAAVRESNIAGRIAAFNDRLERLVRNPSSEAAPDDAGAREVRNGNGRDGKDRKELPA